MKRHENTVFDFTADKDDQLLTTSHAGNTSSIAIHCSGDSGYSAFTIYITKGQAYNLIDKLQKAIINIEVYQKTHNKEV